MSKQQLPARPNLRWLKKTAKQKLVEQRRSDPRANLAAAQLAIARQFGFPSWRAMKAHVDAAVASPKASVAKSLADAFLDASVPKPDADHRGGALAPARAMLREHPDLPEASIYTAAVTGNLKGLERILGADRTLANKSGGVRNWPPLCYLTFSRFLRDGRANRRREFLRAAKILLTSGADPNSSWPSTYQPSFPERALYGAAGIANDGALTKLLLDAGADVNDGESLYHAAEFKDHGALKALLAARPRQGWLSYCMCHKMDMEDPAGLKLFIDAGGDVNFLIEGGVFKGYRPLHFAIFRRRSAKVFDLLLLRAGADSNRADASGVTPYQLARKLGHHRIAEQLLKHGAKDDLDAKTRYLAALASGDRRAAKKLIADDPSLKSQITPTDHHLLVDAAESGHLAAARLMLDQGFPIETRGATYGGWNGTALDVAAWGGSVAVVRLLLSRGADPRLKHSYGGDALGAAIHGANHAPHRKGAKVVALIAGAMKDRGVDLSGNLTYARSEKNRAVVAVLERLAKEMQPRRR